jgi:lipopolysaccharide/colanic/teichoic acid biosynthesis glycosyltransferase
MLFSYISVKLITDKLMAACLTFTLSPLLILISLTLYFTEGKILFIQQRPGLNGKPFKMYKFITMTENNLPDNERVTSLGRFLRKLSLDEFPQILNILKGEMSFIGPRPFLMEYMTLYSAHHKRRHDVMPGITGLAQVTGRNSLRWENKLDLDAYYVDNISFGLDIKIIMLTIVYFLKGCPGSYPATKFSGYHS